MKPILEQLAQEIDAITAEQLDAVMLGDVQEGEEIIGSVADDAYICRAWALAYDYDRRGALVAHTIRFGGRKNRDELIREARRLDAIEDLIRKLAWLEIKRAFPQTLDHDSIGLRAGWIVVKPVDRRREMDATLASLQDAVKRAMGFQTPEEEDEEQVQ